MLHAVSSQAVVWSANARLVDLGEQEVTVNDDADSDKRTSRNRGADDAPGGPDSLAQRKRIPTTSRREDGGDHNARAATNPFDVWQEGLADTRHVASGRDDATAKQTDADAERRAGQRYRRCRARNV